MKKSRKLTSFKEVLDEQQTLQENLDLIEQIREDGLNDLENVGENLKHLSFMINSIQRNYQSLLQQNQQMKALLNRFLKNCYCWEGNRCDQCRNILQILGGFHPSENGHLQSEKPVNAVQEYQSILKQLRKLQ